MTANTPGRSPVSRLEKGTQHGRSAYQLHSSGGWQITTPGHQQANDVLGTQDETIERAREIVRREGGELHIHGQDCQIRDKHTILGG